MSRRVPLSAQVDVQRVVDEASEENRPHRWGVSLSFELSAEEAAQLSAAGTAAVVAWRPDEREPASSFGPVCLVCHGVRGTADVVYGCPGSPPREFAVRRPVHNEPNRARRRAMARAEARAGR